MIPAPNSTKADRGGKASTLAFRVDPRTRDLLEAIAQREGRSLGEILREAVAEWLNSRAAFVEETDGSLIALLTSLKQSKQEGKSWAQLSTEVEKKFGLRLNRNQLKALLES
jgi:hypothetical protein